MMLVTSPWLLSNDAGSAMMQLPLSALSFQLESWRSSPEIKGTENMELHLRETLGSPLLSPLCCMELPVYR